MRKERVKDRKVYSGGQEATRERNSQRFLLQPTSRSHMQNYALDSEQRLTSFYGSATKPNHKLLADNLYLIYMYLYLV